MDPFFLLREVAEISNLQKMSENKDTELGMKQQLNFANYNNMVMANYDKIKDSKVAVPSSDGFDMQSIEERMKRLKFAKQDNSKDPNWF